MTTTRRHLIRVEGIVQGVGFRPFVHRVAHELGIVGQVGNDAQGVVIDAQGTTAALSALEYALRHDAPPLAAVERVTSTELPCNGATSFSIVESDDTGRREALISPDVATCDDCLRELFDPFDRRHLYPFVNCTNCGPRFTIVTDVPYDRAATTMATFEMCAACRREYDDPTDRRFHAQPTCCPACGPQLVLRAAGRSCRRHDAVVAAAQLLRSHAVLALKGLGGYHLAAAATDETAVSALRARKRREAKPFAVMVPDVATAERLVAVDGSARAALTSPARPVVLLPRLGGVPIADSVAPGNRRLGVFLPYTPLHHLLLRSFGGPLVLTSGNVSDEPIAFEDGDARERLAGIADAFLTHDRPILIRTDDSVLAVMASGVVPIRRARGFAPRPLRLDPPATRPLLSCGAELKNTFALARGDRVFVSHHIGDLENPQTLHSFTAGIRHFQRLFDVRPEVVVHDLHPEYLSTKWAMEQDDVEQIAVQHHHAHIAACLADNGVRATVIGVAYDGLGLGTDGTLWGGELLVCDLHGFTRAAHLSAVAMPGGPAAVREPWRMALSWLSATYGSDLPSDLAVRRRHAAKWDAVGALAGSALSPSTSSVGRLFDAVSALCGVRDDVVYEGQAAIELEQLADLDEGGAYPLPIEAGRLDGRAMIVAVVEDVRAGVPAPTVAMRFHRGLARGTVAACDLIRSETGVNVVALSGGVFQNATLVALVVEQLADAGFEVLTHHQVPPNDGGISLGQAAVAAATLAR